MSHIKSIGRVVHCPPLCLRFSIFVNELTRFVSSHFISFRRFKLDPKDQKLRVFWFAIRIMTSTLLHPPAHLPPSVALQLSQQAPIILQNTPPSISSYSISSLYASAETANLWTTYENLMQSCLRTGDEQSAHICLERLTSRFGSENERVMALRGLFREAIAEDDAALERVLEEYESILSRDQTNMVRSACQLPQKS